MKEQINEDKIRYFESMGKLPLDEWRNVYWAMTKEEQTEYRIYMKNRPVNESSRRDSVIVHVNCTMEEDVERNGMVNMEDHFKEIREKYGLSI